MPSVENFKAKDKGLWHSRVSWSLLLQDCFNEKCIKLSLDVGAQGMYNSNNVYNWQCTSSEKSAESSGNFESVTFLWVEVNLLYWWSFRSVVLSLMERVRCLLNEKNYLPFPNHIS